jgi:hypothetical protein
VVRGEATQDVELCGVQRPVQVSQTNLPLGVLLGQAADQAVQASMGWVRPITLMHRQRMITDKAQAECPGTVP